MLPTEGFLKADAKHLPVRELDAIATDPPYGRDSSTMGTKVTTLFAEFLQDAKHCLKDAAHMCISAPVEVDIEGFANQAGFKMKERHLSRVHRSLTRQFVVLQNL
jgi:tRNA (guanine10-N2)-dimethyltransferase